jgi:spermidine/putrescine transport system ATP-binding protein
VFQSYALFPHMTVAQNVAFGLRMEGLDGREQSRRVDEYLALVGLHGFASRYPSQLSGGQQQRVALARALAKRPAVLLLDEPLGALDLKLRRQMQIELSRIHRQVGTTFVFVTHDQEEALSMATRIAVMSAGRVIQAGSPQEIYHHPVDRFVADFIGESNFLRGVVNGQEAAPRFRLADGQSIPAPPGSRAGPATLMVRPETLRIEPMQVMAERPALRGTVVKAAFMGNHTRITVDTAAGALVVLQPHASGAEEVGLDWPPGTEACLWWKADAATILTEDYGGGNDGSLA